MISGDSLIGALPQVTLHHWHPLEIRRITSDSRRVEPGDLFVAIPGVAVDGHRFVPQALRAGAVACVVERMLPELETVPTAIVPNAREALAYLCAATHGFPGRKLRVIGVTGTDGKTTTTRLISAICVAAGRETASVDTVVATIGGQESPTGFHTTTPDAPAMQAYLAQMVDAGTEYAVLEVTSHGLAQHRVTACEFDVAVMTNITHEHLDYHGTYEAYREAKAMLFRALSSSARKVNLSKVDLLKVDVPKVAVLNADDTSYDYLKDIPADTRLSYGVNARADVTADDIRASSDGLHCTIRLPEGELEIASPLVGRYNVYNILAAVSVAYSQGFSEQAMRAGIAAMRGVSGRMERIDMGNALENALQAMREMTDGRVIVVFGCAGLRDRAKRAWMGEIAGRLADRIVITAEDPRTESLDDIMAEIARGCDRAGRQEGVDYWRISDRGEAIAHALRMARPGDAVIVTGKGHERSMCFGTTEYPWSDQETARERLADMRYGG